MSQQANDTSAFTISAAKVASTVYDGSDFVLYRWDNPPCVRVLTIMGGFATAGPGVGYGQIFPIKQDL